MNFPCLCTRMLIRLIAAAVLFAAVVELPLRPADAAYGRVRPSPHWGTTSTPLPPPPSWATPQTLSRFYALYVAYSHLPPVGKPSFNQWLVQIGITSPHLQAQLVALYAWYTGQMHGGVNG